MSGLRSPLPAIIPVNGFATDGLIRRCLPLKAVDAANGHVNGIKLSSGECVDSSIFINAARPFFKSLGKPVGVDLPVHTELHLKAAMKDPPASGTDGRGEHVRDRRSIWLWQHVCVRSCDLLIEHIIKTNMPPYAGDFAVSRYDIPEYQKKLES